MAEQNATRDILRDEYNAAPYHSYPFGQTHPTHLHTLAKLFKLNPSAVENARILELGCAGGGNIIPVALQFPRAEVLGIDLAEKQIEDGVKQIEHLKLNNITLRQQSILDFEAREGKFDYIICHGVYSWVSEAVKDKILQICHEHLTPNGIAYVSYNTLPGWNMVNSVRELMLWHTQSIQDPMLKAQQARSVLKFLVDGLQEDNSSYAQVLRNEINLLSKQGDFYLLHEHLSSFNHPVYFHQFMERANRHHLSYLSDAHLLTMYTDNLPQQFSKELSKIKNIIAVGQYMDFIRNQRFRCTLLCHDTQVVNRAINTQDVEGFYIQLLGKPDNPNFSEKDIKEGSEVSFTNGSLTIKVRSTIAQTALLILMQEQFKPIHYTELCKKLMVKTGVKQLDVIKHHLNNDLNLMRALFAGIININSYPGNYTLEVAKKPTVCPLARFQAQNQNHVTNRRHQTIMLDPLTKVVLPLLDGTLDTKALIEHVNTQIKEGKLSMLDEQKQPIKDEQEIVKRTKSICTTTLENMAKQAIMVECET